MTPEQFCYWLQGAFEMPDGVALTKREQMIADHLQTVFDKKTPHYLGAAPMPTPNTVPTTPNTNTPYQFPGGQTTC